MITSCSQIKSSHDQETKVVYSVSGEGADKPPVGLFTVDINTGMLYVSKPLDREVKDKYEVRFFFFFHSLFCCYRFCKC